MEFFTFWNIPSGSLSIGKGKRKVFVITDSIGRRLRSVSGGRRMNSYSNEEMVDVLNVCGAEDCNGNAAKLLYHGRYSNRRVPHHTTFASVNRRSLGEKKHELFFLLQFPISPLQSLATAAESDSILQFLSKKMMDSKSSIKDTIPSVPRKEGDGIDRLNYLNLRLAVCQKPNEFIISGKPMRFHSDPSITQAIP
ncbi:hypothetical protein TNCV_3008111 [Trichonephila clavipes]|nr:hypothetical protein TNCV_3008111 [Trichonephila clavipes]